MVTDMQVEPGRKPEDNTPHTKLLETAQVLMGSDLRVCAFCVNQGRERCITECAPERKLRCLEPKPLEPWDRLPKLPAFQDTFDMPTYTFRAIMWLCVHYLQNAQRSER